jgi:KipI family sensor histidine kinase inhibitor
VTVRGRYLRFSSVLDVAANDRVHALAAALEETRPAGIREIYPSFGSVYLEWDDGVVATDAVERLVDAALLAAPAAPVGRDVAIGVRYDGADLDAVAAASGLDRDAATAVHAAGTYHAFCIGAAPGQPFTGPNDERLRVPRLPTPRLAVPPHAVAVAGIQTTVYPVAMPGGWNIIGTATDRVYDPHRAEPFLVAAGDRVRYVPGTAPPLGPLLPLALLPAEPAAPALRVDDAGSLDLVVDGGRVRGARLGLAQSGPLDPGAARLANAMVGNATAATLIETSLVGPTLTALRPLVVGVAGAGAILEVDGEVLGWCSVAVRRGARIRVRPSGRGVRGYLAVAGGIASATFAGSASVDRRGAIGRPLAVGDVLGLATEPHEAPRMAGEPARHDGPVRIRLHRGPQHTAEAAAALVSGPFRAEAGDRVGVRLSGPDVPGGELLSESPPLGALQVTTGGTPIILLNDRLRLAGYAKPAVVDPADLGRVAQLRPGEEILFTYVDGPPHAWYRDIAT